MTTIVFTSVPNDLKDFFTENVTYYVHRWASFGVAVIISDTGNDFYLDVDIHKDYITIN